MKYDTPYCPNCGDALEFRAHYSGHEAYGEIYFCPNSKGFEDEELALAYVVREGWEIDSFGVEDKIKCQSSEFKFAGYFHTENGKLKSDHPFADRRVKPI